ncbi:HAD-IIIC family phosphatase [Paludibaculum fermentans]|uniref:HAD-IIIC family phosphatase n=1 Tax=Paludibaculum fermentans TaxID=1473598 RepID=UPI003EBBA900
MTLGQALALIKLESEADQRRRIFLVCGFQPLHLVTFLKGHFAERFPKQAAEILTGLYGDLGGTFTAAAESQAEAAAVVIEWSDLDPRLGLRSAGGWALSVQADILESCREQWARLLKGLKDLAAKMPVALVPPTLPMLFLGHTAGWQASPNELELQKQAASFLAEAAGIGGVSVLSCSSLASVSPEPLRLDAQMEMIAGFPYSIAHASAVASQVLNLLFPPPPMKGLITDLDDTFWSGLVGEVGVQGVSWSLSEHSQIHALYQQMLRHLSEMGVLLAIASKNEQAVVEKALKRDDLLVPAESFFPVSANWGPKSDTVAEILRVWNIGADSVVFVDDSAMELDEVRSAFPAMKCLQFSKKQPAKTLGLLKQLRDLFGKAAVHRDDSLRQASIRANATLQSSLGQTPAAEFVQGLQGRVTFDSRKDPSNKRLLELINKTNQFNLNGVRLSEGEWLKLLEDEAAEVVGVSYEEKFGPLGTIGVLAGYHAGDQFEVTSWVLSCRAFSRRIEHHMLSYLFNQLRVGAVRLAFRPTERNQPLQSCLESFGLAIDDGSAALLSREQFQSHIEYLPHEVRLQNND